MLYFTNYTPLPTSFSFCLKLFCIFLCIVIFSDVGWLVCFKEWIIFSKLWWQPGKLHFTFILINHILQALAAAKNWTFCIIIFSDFYWLILKGGSYSQNYGGGQVSNALSFYTSLLTTFSVCSKLGFLYHNFLWCCSFHMF